MFITEEAPTNTAGRFGDEDVDTSILVHQFPDPLNAIFNSLQNFFLAHPVKAQHEEKWAAIWASEVAQAEARKAAKANSTLSTR
jgi:hypothetical protein